MEGLKVRTLLWNGRTLKLIDQRKIPFAAEYIECTDHKMVYDCIKDMVVRGAPAIGVSAAYGVCLASLAYQGSGLGELRGFLLSSIEYLSQSRPTAVNLFWALDIMRAIVEDKSIDSPAELKRQIMEAAQKIQTDDLQACKDIGANSRPLFEGKKDIGMLTHCNAGALATSGYGTALGVIRALSETGRIKHVFVDETRPYLQGARLTAWELQQEAIPFSIITDNMAAHFISKGEVDAIVVGADRIAANGDSANKIGTLSLAIVAKHYDIPFYIAAPLSTIDRLLKDGSGIPIEERDGNEVQMVMDTRIIPQDMPVRNPSFDVTPAELITALITEKGIATDPFLKNISNLFKK